MSRQFIGECCQTMWTVWTLLFDRGNVRERIVCKVRRERAQALESRSSDDPLADTVDGPAQGRGACAQFGADVVYRGV